jgi:hypothetical protein
MVHSIQSTYHGHPKFIEILNTTKVPKINCLEELRGLSLSNNILETK